MLAGTARTIRRGQAAIAAARSTRQRSWRTAGPIIAFILLSFEGGASTDLSSSQFHTPASGWWLMGLGRGRRHGPTGLDRKGGPWIQEKR